MTVVGTKLEVMKEGNANVAVKGEQVLDTETGSAAGAKDRHCGSSHCSTSLWYQQQQQ